MGVYVKKQIKNFVPNNFSMQNLEVKHDCLIMRIITILKAIKKLLNSLSTFNDTYISALITYIIYNSVECFRNYKKSLKFSFIVKHLWGGPTCCLCVKMT